MYKLRFYDKNGRFNHEEFFTDLRSLQCRYEQYKTSHRIKWMADCPTAWKLKKAVEWERLMGF